MVSSLSSERPSISDRLSSRDQPLCDRTESRLAPGPAQTGIHDPMRERPRPSPGMGIERVAHSAGLLATCGSAPKRCRRTTTNVSYTHRREKRYDSTTAAAAADTGSVQQRRSGCGTLLVALLVLAIITAIVIFLGAFGLLGWIFS